VSQLYQNKKEKELNLDLKEESKTQSNKESGIDIKRDSSKIAME
jgi:hypothetical protein